MPIRNFNIPFPRQPRGICTFWDSNSHYMLAPYRLLPKKKCFADCEFEKQTLHLLCCAWINLWWMFWMLKGDVSWAICTNDNILCIKQGSELGSWNLKKVKFIHLGFESPCRTSHSFTKYVFLPLNSSILSWERLHLSSYLARHGMVKRH